MGSSGPSHSWAGDCPAVVPETATPGRSRNHFFPLATGNILK